MNKKSCLNLIPVINEENTWSMDENGCIVIREKNQKQTREMELDYYGSFVWKRIDGKKRIRMIVEEIISELGEERELAIQRALLFFQMLKEHHLIFLDKDVKSSTIPGTEGFCD